jgi:hypothetical protein
MKRTTPLRLAAAALGVAAVATTALPGLAGPSAPSAPELAHIRAATARYHDVDVALDDGYIPVSPCEQNDIGAMGVHYLHPGLASDAEVDPARPEVLLYLPTSDGEAQLVGVEYFVAATATGGVTPELYGVPFDGPMAGHSPGMPEHYDLHVWAWRHNPDGMTAQWNPALNCPA